MAVGSGRARGRPSSAPPVTSPSSPSSPDLRGEPLAHQTATVALATPPGSGGACGGRAAAARTEPLTAAAVGDRHLGVAEALAHEVERQHLGVVVVVDDLGRHARPRVTGRGSPLWPSVRRVRARVAVSATVSTRLPNRRCGCMSTDRAGEVAIRRRSRRCRRGSVPPCARAPRARTRRRHRRTRSRPGRTPTRRRTRCRTAGAEVRAAVGGRRGHRRPRPWPRVGVADPSSTTTTCTGWPRTSAGVRATTSPTVALLVAGGQDEHQRPGHQGTLTTGQVALTSLGVPPCPLRGRARGRQHR